MRSSISCMLTEDSHDLIHLMHVCVLTENSSDLTIHNVTATVTTGLRVQRQSGDLRQGRLQDLRPQRRLAGGPGRWVGLDLDRPRQSDLGSRLPHLNGPSASTTFDIPAAKVYY